MREVAVLLTSGDCAEQRVLDHAVVTPADRAGAGCAGLVAAETIEFDGAAAGREVLALLQGSVVCGGDPGSCCQAGGECCAGETCGEEDYCAVVYDDDAGACGRGGGGDGDDGAGDRGGEKEPERVAVEGGSRSGDCASFFDGVVAGRALLASLQGVCRSGVVEGRGPPSLSSECEPDDVEHEREDDEEWLEGVAEDNGDCDGDENDDADDDDDDDGDDLSLIHI